MDARAGRWAVTAMLVGAVVGCGAPAEDAPPRAPAPTSATTVRCSEPEGRRLFVRDERLHTTSADLGGGQPAFLFDPASPEALYVFPSTSRDFGLLTPEKGQPARLLERSATRIVAHRSTGDASWLYTIFPQEGFGVISRHDSHAIMGPSAVSFVTPCRVEGGALP